MPHVHHHLDLEKMEKDMGRSVRKRLWWTLLLNFVFLAVELIGGILSGSLALLADAGHMFTDVAALGIAIIASHLAGREPSPKRTFGLIRAEVVGAFINGATLVVIVLFILWEAWTRLNRPVSVDGPLMLVIAVLGLACNLASTLILLDRRQTSLNLRGAFLHMLGDTLGSAGAIAAALVIWTTGWTPADPLVSVLIAGIILWSSLGLLRQTLNIIINATPENIDYTEVHRALMSFDHFTSVHHLHIWNLSDSFPILSAHITLERACVDSGHWHECLKNAQRMLRDDFGIEHTTLQLEPAEYEGNCEIKKP